jgi:hypothetical protein
VDDASWINLFDEQGRRPRRYSPLADGFSAEELRAHLARVRKVMIDAVGRMPRHADYLAQVSDRYRAGMQSGKPIAGR